jgi:hypothetical protein
MDRWSRTYLEMIFEVRRRPITCEMPCESKITMEAVTQELRAVFVRRVAVFLLELQNQLTD